MIEKKPVYNGYEERYLTGLELKNNFENRYYATGRHHSVILGITISDYLSLIEVKDTKQYRIFINDYFCRVMDGETDRLISFFGHCSLERIKTNVNPNTVEIKKVCPNCGAKLKFREGKYGEFLGCSKFPSCRYTMKIPTIGNL